MYSIDDRTCLYLIQSGSQDHKSIMTETNKKLFLHLTDLSDEPLQSQIARQIRAKILAGELAASTDLPSIRALARESRVSVITVQRAYEHLMQEDLIHARRGKGFYVSELRPETRIAMASERLMELLDKPVKTALDEGLNEKDIILLVKAVLKEKTGDTKEGEAQ